MDFKILKDHIVVRVILLTLTALLFGQLMYSSEFGVSQFVVLILVVMQAFALTKLLNKTNNEVIDFLGSIKYDDLTSPNINHSNAYIARLNSEFSKVMDNLKDVRKEKEAEFQYLKNIVQHVGIGLITFDKNGNVQMMNTAARKLLKITHIDNIRDLQSLSAHLVQSFTRLKTGGHDLIKLEIGGDIVQLAVYAIELTLKEEQYKLVSLQNIQSELEEKEMEAWQNLVRVLTHEIMNSVTPISSLAGTVEVELKTQLSNGLDVNQITNDEVEELHLAIQTIQKRSEGLIRFVQDFRNLTHIPQPKVKLIKVKPLIEEMTMLHKMEAEQAGVTLRLDVDPENMTINADKELIEQVLINLIKNAIQAFEDEKLKMVEIKGYFSDKSRPIISVKDNGSGIDEEAVEKIFIPFFTTKKSGSGIGLSLSRQIMRRHQGTLGVKTQMDEGTEFFLRF